MEIRTPSGCRDLTGEDVEKKRWLQQTIMSVFERCSFREVMTPAYEYYQTYNLAFSNLEDRQMLKFVDENGDILSLRMDMTVPIARLAASQYANDPLPLRFCYSSNVYKMRQAFAGKRTEVMDCGVELIGLEDMGDLEVLTCALDTLEALNLPDYTLELADVNFFQRAARMAFHTQEDIEICASLIDRKSMVELETFLKSRNLPYPIYQFFMEMPLLSGGIEVLDRAKEAAFDWSLVEVLDQLYAIYKALMELGYPEVISFDLGKLPHLNYYTGLIFEGFVQGVGTSILSGGRYDTLLEKFGMHQPARGFSVKIDYLMDLVRLPEKRGIYRIYYPQERFMEAFSHARELRRSQPVEMICWDQEDIVEENIL